MMLQRFQAQALKGVRRGAGLVSAAAEELRAGRGHLLGDGEGLFAAFDGAGPGDDGQVAAADGGVGSGKADDGVFFLHVAAGQLVGLGDADDFGDAGERFQVAAVHFALVAGDADGGALGSGKGWARKPNCSICSQTAWISSGVACAFMTTNMTRPPITQCTGCGEGRAIAAKCTRRPIYGAVRRLRSSACTQTLRYANADPGRDAAWKGSK